MTSQFTLLGVCASVALSEKIESTNLCVCVFVSVSVGGGMVMHGEIICLMRVIGWHSFGNRTE